MLKSQGSNGVITKGQTTRPFKSHCDSAVAGGQWTDGKVPAPLIRNVQPLIAHAIRYIKIASNGGRAEEKSDLHNDNVTRNYKNFHSKMEKFE